MFFGKRKVAAGAVAAALAGALGCMPAVTPVAFAQTEPITAQAKIPARYDLREQGVVTPVKQQSPFGTCWAFGGIAAAETSILSDSGMTFAEAPLDLSEKHLAWFAMHPVSALADEAQAGEGIYVDVPEGTTETNAVYNSGGMPIFVTTVFSSGTGPLLEEAYPYRGATGLLESDYYATHSDEIVAMLQDQLGELFSQMDAETLDEYVAELIDLIVSSLRQADYYAAEDDWSIPENDEGLKVSNRMLFSGYTMRDGNVLPMPNVRGEVTDEASMGPWLGLSDEGMRAMKQEILNGRGVSVVYCADSSLPGDVETGEYLNLDTWSQYTFDDADVTHAVCVVGWDDNYPASNFTHTVMSVDEAGESHVDEERSAKTTPPGNGAWIVKNSWGSETDAIPDGLTTADGTKLPANYCQWGIKDAEGKSTGYFYLSYYDKSLTNPESMSFDSDFADGAFFAMQYDFLPAVLDFWNLTSYDNITTANVFTAEATGGLQSVSTRTCEENTRVDFRIYRLSADAAIPEDGELVASFSKNFEYAGFHRVNLSLPVSLKKGERFSVCACASTVDDTGKRIYSAAAASAFDADVAAQIDAVSYHAKAVVNPGESYLQLGPNWVDWAEYQKTDEFQKSATFDYDGQTFPACVDNFSIKAYIRPTK